MSDKNTTADGPTLKPAPCPHKATTRIQHAQWVFGTRAWTYARYRCTDCHVEWDDPTETPEAVQSWMLNRYGGNDE